MAFSSRAGYNQSGGGYLLIISTIATSQLNVYTPGTGSGAATKVGTLAEAGPDDLPGSISTFFTTGKLLKDMGRTIVSSSRTFRKIQAVVGTAAAADSSFGVNGVSPNYASFYLETGREGAAATAGNIALVVRYI